MKRILILSLNYYPCFVGGAEIALKEITDRISPQEIEFHLIALRVDNAFPKTEKIGNVTVHRIGPTRENPTTADLTTLRFRFAKHWYQFGAFLAALKFHRSYHFDALWAMMAHSAGIPAGLFKTIHPEVPYLLSLQEGDPPAYIEKLARPVWPLFKRGFTQANALQPISNFLLAWGRHMGFKGVATVIPNGVDIKKFAHLFSEAELNTMRESLHKKPGELFVVTTSRLVHKNGIDDVIRALPLLPETISFLIYGIGPDEALLKKLALDLGVADRVRFMGYIGHDAMPLILKACDIFIRPSRSEGMGNSFVEAMAAELPVIATQEGGITDFLFDAGRNPNMPTTGWAVDKDSPPQIAEAIHDILAHPEKVAQVKVTAKNLAFQKYDWDVIARHMQTLFSNLGSTR